VVRKPRYRREVRCPGWRQRAGLTGSLKWLFLLFLCVVVPRQADAQTLQLKASELQIADPGACPRIELPAVTSGPVFDADSLLAAGSQAAILGEHAQAASLLREAAARDPGNAVVAYRLARTLDDQGEGQAARQEYCRYLALAPAASDAEEIRTRVRDLALDGSTASDELWRIAGADGLAAYERRDYGAAVEAFARVVEMRPDWADAYYNRAVAYLAASRPEAAMADLERYHQLLPFGMTDPEASAELERLRSEGVTAVRVEPERREGAVLSGEEADSDSPVTMIAPGGALLRGLLVPGLGQVSTRRPLLGITVLAAAAGSVYFGSRTEAATRLQSAVDPFGNSYEYEVRYLERPNQMVGYGAALVITIAAALESFLYAQPHGPVVDRLSTDLPTLSFRKSESGAALVIQVPADRR
jgi:tetratricopeptide (TPR) repeat protein